MEGWNPEPLDYKVSGRNPWATRYYSVASNIRFPNMNANGWSGACDGGGANGLSAQHQKHQASTSNSRVLVCSWFASISDYITYICISV